jgi:hypothetical protein
MPSLRDLEEFKSSFSHLGREDQTRLELDMPPDDLPLPDHEPAVLAADDASTSNQGMDELDFSDLGDLLGSSGPDLNLDNAEPDLGDIGSDEVSDPAADAMGDFLDTIPNDPGTPGAEDDFSMPEDLLNGLADDIEAERASADTVLEGEGTPLEPQPSLEGEGTPLDLGDLPDFGSDDANLSDTSALDLEGELSEDPDSFEDAEPADDESMDLSFDEGDSGFEPLSSLAPASGDLGEDELEASLHDSPMGGDTFDNFNLDSDALKADFNIGDDLASGEAAAEGGFGDDFANLEDFSLPGIDNVFNGRTPGAVPGQTAQAGAAGVAVDEADLLGEVEEISLTDEEFGTLQDTLASYPLNLRIACEELIAEEAVSPDLMSNLVKLLTRGAPAKETAVLAGKI